MEEKQKPADIQMIINDIEDKKQKMAVQTQKNINKIRNNQKKVEEFCNKMRELDKQGIDVSQFLDFSKNF